MLGTYLIGVREGLAWLAYLISTMTLFVRGVRRRSALAQPPRTLIPVS